MSVRVKRQVCRKCLGSCDPKLSLTFDNEMRALHWCEGCQVDALNYARQADPFDGMTARILQGLGSDVKRDQRYVFDYRYRVDSAQ
jgi:hypothetical protein